MENESDPKKALRISRKEKREIETEVRNLKGRGLSDLEIMAKLSIEAKAYKHVLARIKDKDREKFTHLDSVDVYSDFVEKSRILVKDLEKMQKRFDYRKQFTALVACIKQKHDINKDVVKMGQQLGFIEDKGGGEVSVETELVFSTMTTEDVKSEVKKEVARLNAMAGKSVIEMRPELLSTLEGDEKRIRRFIPDNITIQEPEDKDNKKLKIKTKMKLKRR